jgi:hypothetical protein
VIADDLPSAQETWQGSCIQEKRGGAFALPLFCFSLI